METFDVNLFDIQPTQLYISRTKLLAVQRALKKARGHAIEAIPLRRLGDALVCTDGHTRLTAAFLAGQQRISATWETDVLDWQAYRICVRWCRETNIRSVRELAPRVVSEQDYEVLWLARCRQMHDDLRRQRDKRGSGFNPSGDAKVYREVLGKTV